MLTGAGYFVQVLILCSDLILSRAILFKLKTGDSKNPRFAFFLPYLGTLLHGSFQRPTVRKDALILLTVQVYLLHSLVHQLPVLPLSSALL